ncbi:MAG: hypothetical protein NT062_36205 [Proteobacteria bacterium]|nr:hypothetical protein [Pseudomonadota bacterium]
MSATAVEELTTHEAEQIVAVEPEALAAEPAAVETAAPVSEVPAVAPEVEQTTPAPTASEQAYGHDEMSAHDRETLIRTADYRIAQAAAPFVLACSNRRQELRAAANHPKLIATLGKIAFGDLLPGVSKGNATSGAGMPDAAGKMVSKSAQKPSGMKKTLERVNKIPMLNFNINYPHLVATETDEEFVDILGDGVGTANEAMRVGLEGRSNEDLAALCAAFDPMANSTSVFEDHIDAALSKIAVEPKAAEEKQIEEKPVKALAAAGEPDEAKKLQAEVAERDKAEGRKPETDKAGAKDEHVAARTAEEEHVVQKLPDEMRELYDDRSYNRV